LRDIITQVRDLVDPALPLGLGEVPYRPDQVMHLEADISALHQATGWSPRRSLKEGLARTVEDERNKG
jgi:nucleoside-diphosphate-sugar epimerase